jgi:hypothetical protein
MVLRGGEHGTGIGVWGPPHPRSLPLKGREAMEVRGWWLGKHGTPTQLR